MARTRSAPARDGKAVVPGVLAVLRGERGSARGARLDRGVHAQRRLRPGLPETRSTRA